jgi:hypothetical protein
LPVHFARVCLREYRAVDKNGAGLRKFEGAASHYANFIGAVRSRKHTDLSADILEGHISSALCHTGNISYRLGKPHSPEQLRDALRNQPEMAEAFGRMQEHLAANQVDCAGSPLLLGPLLAMNPRTERFRGHRQANTLLTREYRKPFVVPDKV